MINYMFQFYRLCVRTTTKAGTLLRSRKENKRTEISGDNRKNQRREMQRKRKSERSCFVFFFSDSLTLPSCYWLNNNCDESENLAKKDVQLIHN